MMPFSIRAALERMAKEEGEEGQKKIAKITRYTTVGLGLLMGWAYYQMLVNYSASGFSIITKQGFLPLWLSSCPSPQALPS